MHNRRFADVLKTWIGARTNAAVAPVLGVSESTVHNWLTGSLPTGPRTRAIVPIIGGDVRAVIEAERAERAAVDLEPTAAGPAHAVQPSTGGAP